METATSARVNLSFIKLRPQLLRLSNSTRVGPRQQRRRGSSICINTHQAVPKRRNRKRFNLTLIDTSPRKQVVHRSHYDVNQQIRIYFRKIRSTLSRALNTFDLTPTFIKQRHADTRRAHVNTQH